MANTAEVGINNSTWTEIAAAGTEGFVTNENSNKKVVYRESDVLPSAGSFLGHTLDFAQEPYFSFKMEAGQKPYAKSIAETAKLVVTLK